MLEVASDGSFLSIGVHCYGGNINSGSTIGHQGNDIDAFVRALALAQDGNAGGEGDRCSILSVGGNIAGFMKIAVPLTTET